MLVGMVRTGFPDDGGSAADNGGDGDGVGSMNLGGNACGGSVDCFFEAGGPSSIMGSGMVAYRGRVWDGGDEGYAVLIACPWEGHPCSHVGVGWNLPGEYPAHRRQHWPHS